ncbi:MAG TPA: DUF6391 domain-containing protein [Anaerolineales bacterium]|nr:DUF6391 domain-containing protein [Anaerolineales bacterium]
MILDLPLILETRRNHALEHATLHILADKYKNQNMAGHSNPAGFFLFGSFTTEDIRSAVTEAIGRLRAGERGLAVHPGCGTNLVATAFLPGLFAWAPFQGVRSPFWRVLLIPVVVLFAVLGFLLSRPVGTWLQANVTTEADLGNLRVVEIAAIRKGVHRIVTK